LDVTGEENYRVHCWDEFIMKYIVQVQMNGRKNEGNKAADTTMGTDPISMIQYQLSLHNM
jgi:hypothetical protein